MIQSEFNLRLCFRSVPDKWLTGAEQDAMIAKVRAVLGHHFNIVPNASYELDSSITIEVKLDARDG